jgi:hypothetical protein
VDRVLAPSPGPDLQLKLQKQPSADPGPAAQAAEQRHAEYRAALNDQIAPDNLQVTLDQSAGRFVQTLTDHETSETLRRYPSEAQLAYSRAVMAYMRALQEYGAADRDE